MVIFFPLIFFLLFTVGCTNFKKDKAILEETVPDAENQGRIAFEVLVGLLEIGDYWTQNGAYLLLK